MGSRRKKPLYRARNVALGVVLVVVGWIGMVIVRATAATSGTAVDYQQKLFELTQSGQPEGKDGWPLLMDAVAILESVRDDLIAELGKEPPDEWQQYAVWPMDFTFIRDSAAASLTVDQTLRAMQMMRERGLYDKLAELATCPRAVRPKQQGLTLQVLLPELGHGRNMARMCAARMFLASRSGDSDEFVAAFEQMLALARVFMNQPMIIDRLVGVAITAFAVREVSYSIGEGLVDAETAKRVLAAMDRQLSDIPPIEKQFEGERLCLLDSVQYLYSDNGRGDGRLLLNKIPHIEAGGVEGAVSGLGSHPIVNVAGIFFPGKKSVTDKANAYYDHVIRLSRLPRSERDKDPFKPDVDVESLPRGYMVLRMLMPALSKAMISQDQLRMDLAGVRIMIALELHRAEHGAYPARLDQLVPGLLRELPIDAISGKPFGYRLLPPEERGVWEYVLYSVGTDGQDDGGVEDATGRYKALQGQSAGSDFIINEPRPAPR